MRVSHKCTAVSSASNLCAVRLAHLRLAHSWAGASTVGGDVREVQLGAFLYIPVSFRYRLVFFPLVRVQARANGTRSNRFNAPPAPLHATLLSPPRAVLVEYYDSLCVRSSFSVGHPNAEVLKVIIDALAMLLKAHPKQALWHLSSLCLSISSTRRQVCTV